MKPDIYKCQYCLYGWHEEGIDPIVCHFEGECYAGCVPLCGVPDEEIFEEDDYE